ncbi:MAG TPA: endonuclease/exonuclease/phosphatase family protein, partial [Methylomirabilota bacterium]|nr:endonuclease/exonuclease/phosphatase family protein [Methylomirabilota bacterium]
PAPGHYTWWDLKKGSRARNLGWRIDYFFVSDELRGCVRAATILPHVLGSDHCPITLTLA